MTGFPQINPRIRVVNEARNQIERMVLDYPKITELTCSEVAYILTELGFRWAGLAIQDERDTDALTEAAPDLLAGCKAALGAFEKNHCINWDDLARAIKKAEGKS